MSVTRRQTRQMVNSIKIRKVPSESEIQAKRSSDWVIDKKSNNEYVELPLEIKIESVTSLNPEYENQYSSPNNAAQSAVGISRGKQRKSRTLLVIYADDGTRYFPCLLCTWAFLKKSQLVYHIEQQHHGQYGVCRMCCCLFDKRSKVYRKSFTHHMSQHGRHKTAVQSRQCPYCLFWFAPSCIGTHMHVHNPVRKHTCHLCKYKFRRVDGLKKHLSVCHGYEQ